MTPDQLLTAMRDLGYGVLYDPEHQPDGPTEADISDLLGRLAAIIDGAVFEHVKPDAASMEEFRAGYMSNIPTRRDSFRTLMVRTATTGLLPDTNDLHAVDGVAGFTDSLVVAASALYGASRSDD